MSTHASTPAVLPGDVARMTGNALRREVLDCSAAIAPLESTPACEKLRQQYRGVLRRHAEQLFGDLDSGQIPSGAAGEMRSFVAGVREFWTSTTA